MYASQPIKLDKILAKEPSSVSVRQFTLALIEVKELDSDSETDSECDGRTPSILCSPMNSPLSPMQSETPLTYSFDTPANSKLNDRVMADRMRSLTDNEDLRRFVLQKKSKSKKVRFDQLHGSRLSLKRLLLSSLGLSSGCHSWSIQIAKTDVDVQEMGVISAADISGITMHERGVRKTKAFGARALFGSELATQSVFRGSYNGNGKKRCAKDLSAAYKIGWCCGDEIRIRLDLAKNRPTIKFWWNGVHVKNMMRVQKDTTYYPSISFSGNCRYILL